MPGHRRVVTVALIGGLLLGACDSGSGSEVLITTTAPAGRLPALMTAILALV